jgi:anti-sigma regulatory factor (Ser/Thr protein kinase)
VTAADIKLKIPHEERYHGIARLVVGGLAARLDLSYEHLDDLQLALATVLENDGYVIGSDVTVELHVRDDGVSIVIGPLVTSELRADLAKDDETVSLGRLLSTVVESVEVEERTDGGWLRLEKELRLTHS